MDLVLREGAAILIFIARAFVHLAPYLLLSIPLAVWIRRSGIADRIRGRLSTNPYIAVLTATLVGALSPFCSCGVIPIIASLLLSGVPLAPVMAFWLASPSMDPEVFLLSVGTIGWELAIWRLAATFVMSFGGGLAVLYQERRGWLRGDMLRPSVSGSRSSAPLTGPAFSAAAAGEAPVPALESASAGCRGLEEPASLRAMSLASCDCREAAVPAPPAPSCGCGSRESSATPPPGGSGPASGLRDLAVDAGRTTWRILRYLGIAILMEALIIRYAPQNLIASLLGTKSPLGIPLATLVSVPMYTTNLTALGLVAGLLKQGMSGGAALAFLIGGPVTTLPAMSAVYLVVRRRVFGLYLAFCAAGALLAGYAFQGLRAFWP